MHYLIKELFAEKTRILLTILAVAWATFTISGMLAIGEGARMSFANSTLKENQAQFYIEPGQTSKNHRGQAQGKSFQLIAKDYEDILKGVPNIQLLIPIYQFNAKLQSDTMHTSARFNAVPATYQQVQSFNLTPGSRFLNPLDEVQKRNVVVIGEKISDQLFPKNVEPIGKVIQIGNFPFRIVGVMLAKKRFFSHGFPDEFLAWIPMSTYLTLSDDNTIKELLLIPKTLKNLEQLKKQLTAIVAKNHGFSRSDDALLDFHDTLEMQEKTLRFFLGMEIFLGLVGFMTLIVAGVGITNVTTVCVHRATREIGIRMAIGAKRRSILLHYLLQALLATLLGGFFGLMGILLFLKLLMHFIADSSFFHNLGDPTPVLSYLVVSVVIGFLAIIGLLAGWFPAYKATQVDPAVALRHS